MCGYTESLKYFFCKMITTRGGYWDMAMSDSKSTTMTATFFAGSLFSILALPLAAFGSPAIEVGFADEPSNNQTQLTELAPVYVGVATVAAIGAGVAGASALGWKRSVKKSNSVGEKVVALEQQLHDKERQLEEAMLSENRLKEAGLAYFLGEPESVLPLTEAETAAEPQFASQMAQASASSNYHHGAESMVAHAQSGFAKDDFKVPVVAPVQPATAAYQDFYQEGGITTQSPMATAGSAVNLGSMSAPASAANSVLNQVIPSHAPLGEPNQVQYQGQHQGQHQAQHQGQQAGQTMTFAGYPVSGFQTAIPVQANVSPATAIGQPSHSYNSADQQAEAQQAEAQQAIVQQVMAQQAMAQQAMAQQAMAHQAMQSRYAQHPQGAAIASQASSYPQQLADYPSTGYSPVSYAQHAGHATAAQHPGQYHIIQAPTGHSQQTNAPLPAAQGFMSFARQRTLAQGLPPQSQALHPQAHQPSTQSNLALQNQALQNQALQNQALQQHLQNQAMNSHSLALSAYGNAAPQDMAFEQMQLLQYQIQQMMAQIEAMQTAWVNPQAMAPRTMMPLRPLAQAGYTVSTAEPISHGHSVRREEPQWPNGNRRFAS